MLKEGIKKTSTVIVDTNNTAAGMGSGDLQVFATPAMVALMENAAMEAVAPFLPEGSSTVGAEICTTHIKPSGIGAKISATAILTAIEGRKLIFEIEACDSEGIIGKGTHTRYIIDKERFLAKISKA